jgi:hypothetical protein
MQHAERVGIALYNSAVANVASSAMEFRKGVLLPLDDGSIKVGQKTFVLTETDTNYVLIMSIAQIGLDFARSMF